MQSINRLIEKSKNGFTLIELLVVVAMIALITGAVSISLSSAMQRSRIQKATSEVKIISQAILSYENYAGDLDKYVCEDKEIDKSSFPFLLIANSGQSKQTTKLPALLQASLSAGGVMRDPWGKPYRVTIRKGNIKPESLTPTAVQTGYRLQNFYRLTEKERK